MLSASLNKTFLSLSLRDVEHDRNEPNSTLYVSAGEQTERAFNLGLAAVLGDGVYNFGELVSCSYTFLLVPLK